MKWRGALVAIALALTMIVLWPSPAAAHPATVTAPHFAPVRLAPTAVHPVPLASAHLAPAPRTSYARTVVVETFTAEWCIYCEQESQALYVIEHNYGRNVLDIGEIHDCYSVSTCGDGYQTVDGTSAARTAYYQVTGFPTVMFDGVYGRVGADSTLQALESDYEHLINESLMFPGNVSISQTAELASGGNVNVNVGITSAVNGTYHALSYLVEYIGKNDSTGHDLGYVVRRSIVDQTVTLTAGSTTQLTASGALVSGWKVTNLSVITFLQENTTRIVENANMVPVNSLVASVAASPTTLFSGNTSTLSVRAVNTSTNAPVAGALVTFRASGGAQVTPSSAVTGSDGTATANFTAPVVTSAVTYTITAAVSAPGYSSTPAVVDILVNPVTAPSVPTELALVPGGAGVSLAWNVPATGGGGVTYNVYRAHSPTGTFTSIGSTTSMSFVDPSLVPGIPYWYRINAENIGGFSLNTTVVSAIPLSGTAQGLPQNVGWWITINSVQYNSSAGQTVTLYLSSGTYDYQFGSDSYDYVASDSSGSLAFGSSEVQLAVTFTPNYAVLQGQVSPSGATVTLNGAPLQVVGGQFLQADLVAGTYTVEATSPGYQATTVNVTLTPGNTTTQNLDLQKASTPVSPSQPSSGFGASEMGILTAAAVAVIVAAGAGFLLVSRRRQNATRSQRARPPARSDDGETDDVPGDSAP